jgi:hemolysin III
MARLSDAQVRDRLAYYTRREETANAVSHGIGTGLSLVGLGLLVTRAAERSTAPTAILSFAVYGATLVLLHLASTLYHSTQRPRVRLVMRILDHGSIYLLIAGTYTPFLVVGIPGPLARVLLPVVWGLALLGIVRSVFLIGRFRILTPLTYVFMGWLVVIAARQLLARIPAGGLALILGGGLAYMLGLIFFAWKRLPYNHAIWHLFVLGGSICHYFAILLYLLPEAGIR